jgi:hypothetical protein
MATTFVYSVTQDIPGGVFNGDISTRLANLIQKNIVTQLLEVSSTGDVLTIRFITDLSAAEKTILDGDTTNPAGGLVSQAADYAELTHVEGAQTINEFDRIVVAANGIVSATIASQLKRGDGVSIKGKSEQQVFATDGLSPTNKSKDNLNTNGSATFIIGPSFNRGVVYVTVTTSDLPDRNFEVQFE